MSRSTRAHCPWRTSVLAVTVALAETLGAGEIQWRSGPATPRPLTATERAQVLTDLARDAASRHLVVQFTDAVAPAEHARLAELGLTLLCPLGSHAYFATLDPHAALPALAQSAGLAWVGPIAPEWKTHPDFDDGGAPPWALVEPRPDGTPLVAAYVLLHGDVPLEPALGEVLARHAGAVHSYLRSVNGAVVQLPRAALGPLAAEDAVQWLEPPLPGWDVLNDSNRALTQVEQVFAPPYGLTGAGVRVMVYDGATCRATHVDFQGRLQNHDSVDPALHSTHVAGTIGGAGLANPTYRGMAPGVLLDAFAFEVLGGLQPGFLYTDPGDLEADYDTALNGLGADLANNSIGSNIELNNYNCAWQGDYGVTDALIDAIVRGSLGRPFRVIWSGGNERQGNDCDIEGFGDYYSIAPPSGAKNHLCVGAVNSNNDSMTAFSSWGPTDDGRLKPDLVAPGCQSNGDLGVTSCSFAGDSAYAALCGTSQAAPTVTGLAALLLEDYRAHYPGQPDFRNATLKAMLVQTAADLGNAGPDYQVGYGSVRIREAVDLLRAGNFVEAEVEHGTTYRVRVEVAPGTPELRVTLAWDDAPGTPNVLPALVNDLDLRVFAPGGQRAYPWTLNPASPATPAVRTAEDHRNNLEQVWVPNPQPGIWRIDVHGTNVPSGPQPCALAAEPLLVPCSSTGALTLDAPIYACSDVMLLRVVDCDLNTNDNAVESTSVTLASLAEPAGETVVLTETAPASADFRGSIALAPLDAPGILRVLPGDLITATYVDLDNGLGQQQVPVVRTATTDCLGPVITDVQVVRVGSEFAVIGFTTSEPARGAARIGAACDALGPEQGPTEFRTVHTLQLTGLEPATRYYFALSATDAAGNTTLDDHAGACYALHTPEVVYEFLLDTNPGWATQGQWAWGVPTGGGSNNHDPTSGHTGAAVYGYNLNGDYPNALPAKYLTTTALDCTGRFDVSLAFWRWLGVESHANFDQATVEVSRDGVEWHVVWRATDGEEDIADQAWVYQEFDISEEADNEPNVYIRWGMGPTDQNVTFPGWNIDDIRIFANAGTLALGFPEGLPSLLTPGVPTTIMVRIVEGTDVYVPGSAMLHYRYAPGPFTSSGLTPLGGGYYLATLPPADCTASPAFYFSATGEIAGQVLQPPGAPNDLFGAAVGTEITVVEDDFEQNLGWSVSGTAVDGHWQRGVPVNGGRGDPPADSDGSGKCYVTDNVAGNSDVDGGYTVLTSPAFEVNYGMMVGYAYWLNDLASSPLGPGDSLKVEFATNPGGTNWQLVREYTTAAAYWRSDSVLVGPEIPASTTLRVRFTCVDADPGSVVEGGLDAFRIVGVDCSYTGTCGDGILSQGEVRIDCGGPCPPCGCTSDPPCDDGNPCNGLEFCDAWGDCAPGPITDCNENGVADSCDVTEGTSWDDNGNGVPDECESTAGDVNCDGAVSLQDVNGFVLLLVDPAAWRIRYPGCLRLNGDTNGDGAIEFRDINPFVRLLGGN